MSKTNILNSMVNQLDTIKILEITPCGRIRFNGENFGNQTIIQYQLLTNVTIAIQSSVADIFVIFSTDYFNIANSHLQNINKDFLAKTKQHCNIQVIDLADVVADETKQALLALEINNLLSNKQSNLYKNLMEMFISFVEKSCTD